MGSAKLARGPAPTSRPALATRSPRIGLALGSGGARGLAHIGVIEVLEEHGVSIDFVAGTSIGALVGGLYASGATSEDLRRIASGATLRKIINLFDPSLRQGFIRGTRLERSIEDQVGGLRVEGCRIPLAIIATDLRSGETVVFQEGDLASAVRASVSVPWVFRPVQLEGRLLADGGLSMPVPAEQVRSMGAEVVVAVDLDWERPVNDPSKEDEPGLWQIANDSLALLRRHLAAQDARYADVVVRPAFGREVRWDGFLDPDELIECGRVAMRSQMGALEAATATRSSELGATAGSLGSPDDPGHENPRVD